VHSGRRALRVRITDRIEHVLHCGDRFLWRYVEGRIL
jgi:hypothetical protein